MKNTLPNAKYILQINNNNNNLDISSRQGSSLPFSALWRSIPNSSSDTAYPPMKPPQPKPMGEGLRSD